MVGSGSSRWPRWQPGRGVHDAQGLRLGPGKVAVEASSLASRGSAHSGRLATFCSWSDLDLLRSASGRRHGRGAHTRHRHSPRQVASAAGKRFNVVAGGPSDGRIWKTLRFRVRSHVTATRKRTRNTHPARPGSVTPRVDTL
jgi:hypothetical protein